MSRKVLLRDVHVTEDDNTVTVLKAGSSVPEKLAKYVTNPKAFVDAEPETSQGSAAGGSETIGYSDLALPQLKALLKDRELAVGGNKQELVERLTEHDAAKQTADGGVSTGQPVNYTDLGVEQLQLLLKDRELPVDGERAELIERLEFDDLEREDEQENQE